MSNKIRRSIVLTGRIRTLYSTARWSFQWNQFPTSIRSFATEVPNQPPQTKLAETRLRRFWRLVEVEKHNGTIKTTPFSC
jgi:hypothetical protein